MTLADLFYIISAIASAEIYFTLNNTYGIHVLFYICSCCSFASMVLIYLFVPETLEEIQLMLKGTLSYQYKQTPVHNSVSIVLAMGLVLYMHPASPPSRAVQLTLHALGLQDKVELVQVKLFEQEQLKPEFIKKNPLHTIPVLEDGDFTLWDSHAINAYLVNKYAKNDDLYPRDPKKRALVDSMGHFDSCYLFGVGVHFGISHYFPERYPEKEKLKTKLAEIYDALETILEQRTFVAGDQMTIADLSVVTTLSTTVRSMPLDEKKHLKIISWFDKMKQLSYYYVNQVGLDALNGAFTAKKNKTGV